MVGARGFELLTPCAQGSATDCIMSTRTIFSIALHQFGETAFAQSRTLLVLQFGISTQFLHIGTGISPRPLGPQCRPECTPCARRLVKHAFRVRAINLELPRFAPEPLQGPLQCADGAMRKTALRIRQTAAHIPGIFGLLSEQPRRILHYKGIYHQLSATLLVVSAKCRLFLRQG